MRNMLTKQHSHRTKCKNKNNKEFKINNKVLCLKHQTAATSLLTTPTILFQVTKCKRCSRHKYYRETNCSCQMLSQFVKNVCTYVHCWLRDAQFTFQAQVFRLSSTSSHFGQQCNLCTHRVKK